MGLKKEIVVSVGSNPSKLPGGTGGGGGPAGLGPPPPATSSSPLSVSYCWSPMEKLIFHLSPVSRRKSLRTSAAAFQNGGGSGGAGRRTMSEPNKNRVLLRGPRNGANNGFIKKAALSADMRALALVAIREVVAASFRVFCHYRT